MGEIIELTSSWPPFLAYPLLLLVIVVALGPKLYSFWTDIVPWNREYVRTKKRLELRKLELEIENLRGTVTGNHPKKEKKLEANHPLFDEASGKLVEDVKSDKNKKVFVLFVLNRLSYGVIGAFLPLVIGTVIYHENSRIAFLHSGTIGASIVIGAVSALLLWNSKSGRYTFILGVAITSILLWLSSTQTLISELAQQEEIIKELHRQANISSNAIELESVETSPVKKK